MALRVLGYPVSWTFLTTHNQRLIKFIIILIIITSRSFCSLNNSQISHCKFTVHSGLKCAESLSNVPGLLYYEMLTSLFRALNYNLHLPAVSSEQSWRTRLDLSSRTPCRTHVGSTNRATTCVGGKLTQSVQQTADSISLSAVITPACNCRPTPTRATSARCRRSKPFPQLMSHCAGVTTVYNPDNIDTSCSLLIRYRIQSIST